MNGIPDHPPDQAPSETAAGGGAVAGPTTARVTPPAAPGAAVRFHSILFPPLGDRATPATLQPPGYFSDLNLDQVVDAITAGREEYDLKPLFYQPVQDVRTIRYRHQVFRDLGDATVLQQLTTFAASMREVRQRHRQAARLHYRYQQERWFLDAVAGYCAAVSRLADGLARATVHSHGLRGLRDYLSRYSQSTAFTTLAAETARLGNDLAAIHYCLQVRGNRVTVRRYDSEPDYSAEVDRTFAKFRQEAAKDYRVSFSHWPEMNHVEARILDRVALLFKEVFGALDDFCGRRRSYQDPILRRVDREVHFYIAYLEYLAPPKAAGLPFCYPRVSRRSKEVLAHDTFDLALARHLLEQDAVVVQNDFYLEGKERIFVVSGPNQGGKTTFARTFGQLHHLAGVGCPVPGTAARLFQFDRMFTHFAREEQPGMLGGKLEEDLKGVHATMWAATTDSIVIMNELFTSTSFQDARFLGAKVIDRALQLGLLAVYVTFVDELSAHSPATVSMVSTVAPGTPPRRTYRVLRRKADGLAYAMALAESYELTYPQLVSRLKP